MTKIVRIEVKTTDKQKWVVGEKATNPARHSSDAFWVLVRLPPPLDTLATDDARRGAHAPRYFVLSTQEM